MKKSLLVLDDNIIILDILNKTLTDRYDIVLTQSLNQAMNICSVVQFDFVVTDINLGFDGEFGGLDFVEFLSNLNFRGKIILISGYMQEVPKHLKSKVHFMLNKPFAIDNLIYILEDDVDELD